MTVYYIFMKSNDSDFSMVCDKGFLTLEKAKDYVESQFNSAKQRGSHLIWDDKYYQIAIRKMDVE